jgi:O-antigen ligase
VVLWLYIALLAWLPFPLGSAVVWGAPLFEILVAICWILWLAANIADPSVMLPRPAWLWFPLGLYGLVLLWAVLQIVPVPARFAHPLWAMASDVLGRHLPGTISIDPWRTKGEILKLSAQAGACWLAYSMGRDRTLAKPMFNAVIVIGALYAAYGLGLAVINSSQAQLIYRTSFPNKYLSGPFMLHNSFATYCGLACVAALSKLVAAGSDLIVVKHGARRFALSVVQYVFGGGVPWLVAFLLTFACVTASASRGGFVSLLAGLVAMAILAALLAKRSSGKAWAVAAIAVVLCPVLFFIVSNSDTLAARLDTMLDAGAADDVRLALWAASRRMIASVPWQGLGLGTFQDAYPLYSDHALAFVMDKAHSDYLELVAGLGLPAAGACLLAIALLAWRNVTGALARRRDRYFCVAAVGATAIVAVHSGVDFSLQIPAIAVSYATILGLGLAQTVGTKA